MALVEMKVPSPGESISEVQISKWLKNDGDYVEKDEEIAEIDSDKATLTIAAEASGTLKIVVKEGDTVPVGALVCTIDDSAAAPKAKVSEPPAKAPAPAAEKKEEKKPEKKETPPAKQEEKTPSHGSAFPSPLAEKIMKENNLSAEQVAPSGKSGRITKADVMQAMAARSKPKAGAREMRREKMTMLRKKVSERLVAVKQQTAMLTTFNEVDMSAIMDIRKKYKDTFKEKHGVGLGFMSFFTKAVCSALKSFPAVNAQIDGDEIVYHDYCDIGIAVSAPKGLMVPVIRDAETLSLAEIEKQVLTLAGKAREGKITIEEMTGGTFTITNGGVFGSMLSTPIINPPQSAILGMHNIVERPVAVSGQVVIKPVMYIALSYDHRIIDGRESVSFLVQVKKMLENPEKILFDGGDPVKILLDI